MKGDGGLLPESDLGRSFLEKYERAVDVVHSEVLELDDVIEKVYVAMLAEGHVILDGEPGVGKTLVCRAVARTVDASCSFIQFTPETMPQDLFYSMGGFGEDEKGASLHEMTLGKGPVFSQIVIADEINRAIPRIHGALLAPLEEKKISLEGKEHDLSPFYFWMATQNPVETSESTSHIPEALKERFLLMVQVPYPDAELLRRITLHDTRPKRIKPVLSVADIVEIRDAIFEQYVLGHDTGDPVIAYIQGIVTSLHGHPAVRWGPGIRAAQDLARAAAVHAFLHGRERIAFDDVKAVAHPALRFKFQYSMKEARRHVPPLVDNDDAISEVLSSLPLVT